jgi:hypothetical protein
MSKKDAVVSAIRKLGANASVTQIRREVEEVTRGPISNQYVSMIRADVLGNTLNEFPLAVEKSTTSATMTKKRAVETVIERLGDRTSLRTLVQAASKLCGTNVTMIYASILRSQWRQKNRKLCDNRTYEGQPDRDMVEAPLLTASANIDSLRAVREYVGSTPRKVDELLGLLAKFGSVDTLRTALTQYRELHGLFGVAS